MLFKQGRAIYRKSAVLVAEGFFSRIAMQPSTGKSNYLFLKRQAA
jgi:hypothetical protein